MLLTQSCCLLNDEAVQRVAAHALEQVHVLKVSVQLHRRERNKKTNNNNNLHPHSGFVLVLSDEQRKRERSRDVLFSKRTPEVLVCY